MSQDLQITLAVIALSVAILIMPPLGRLLSQRRREESRPEMGSLSFDDPFIRGKLQDLLHAHGITGNANIRDGRVLAVPTPGDRVGLARLFIQSYHRGLNSHRNPNVMLCVFRDGETMPLEITLGDLLDAATLLEDGKP